MVGSEIKLLKKIGLHFTNKGDTFLIEGFGGKHTSGDTYYLLKPVKLKEIGRFNNLHDDELEDYGNVSCDLHKGDFKIITLAEKLKEIKSEI